jgi:hypothetical protein
MQRKGLHHPNPIAHLDPGYARRDEGVRDSLGSEALGAAAFGAANVIVGVLAYQGIAWLIRGFVRTRRPAQQG